MANDRKDDPGAAEMVAYRLNQPAAISAEMAASAQPVLKRTRPPEPPRNSCEQQLVAIWRGVLNVEQIGINDNFFKLGGDSTRAIQMLSRAKREGLIISPRFLYVNQTIAELAAALSGDASLATEQQNQSGKAHLLPNQQWFFESTTVDPHHYNNAVVIEVHERLDEHALRDAIQAVIAHHDTLRLRFEPTAIGWVQRFNPGSESVPFERIDLSSVPGPERDKAELEAAQRVQAGLDLQQGPLLRAVWFDNGTRYPSRLLIVAHQLILDLMSRNILIHDLLAAYKQRVAGETVELLPKTTSYKKWSQILLAYATSESAKRELDYWTGFGGLDLGYLPTDASGANTVACEQSEAVSLSAPDSQALLHQLPSVVPMPSRFDIYDVLFTALASSLSEWTGHRAHAVMYQNHGREEWIGPADLSRTTGWFSCLFPVYIDLAGAGNPARSLHAVKKQLQAVPNRGIGYGVLRYLHPDPEVSSAAAGVPSPQVRFIYHGNFDLVPPQGSWKITGKSLGSTRSPRQQRPYLLDLQAWINSGQLHLQCRYSAEVHRKDTITRFLASMRDSVRGLAKECSQPYKA